MATQDFGARRFDVVPLEQDHISGLRESPMAAVSPAGKSVGSSGFKEHLKRHFAECPDADRNREERASNGLVKWKTEQSVPDVGGIQWRTRSGHLLKNQVYYSKRQDQNWWDVPSRAGTKTWKEWHGPRQRTDAPMMERLDNFQQQQELWEAKKKFVNTKRVETLDRFHNRKLNRDQLSSSPSWAPHLHSSKDIHDSFDTFDSDFDAKPVKALKSLFTPEVLKRDRDAIRAITKRIQNEETWKAAWKHLEHERRMDLHDALEQRQAYTDMLEQLSGQPPRSKIVRDQLGQARSTMPNNCSLRTEGLSQPRPAPAAGSTDRKGDVTRLGDFRGLIHADHEHALEALFPGHGHDLSVGFRQQASQYAQAAYPSPPAPATPRKSKRKTGAPNCTLATGEPIPSSVQRLEGIAGRHHDVALKDYAQAQFLATTAPPPPDQSQTLMKEDWSPASTLRDPARSTMSNFMRTSPKAAHLKKSKSVMELPPPMRSMTYPVLAHASPTPSPSHTDPKGGPWGKGSQSTPTLQGRYGIGNSVDPAATRAVCDELDRFEATAQVKPRLCCPESSDQTGPTISLAELEQESSGDEADARANTFFRR